MREPVLLMPDLYVQYMWAGQKEASRGSSTCHEGNDYPSAFDVFFTSNMHAQYPWYGIKCLMWMRGFSGDQFFIWHECLVPLASCCIPYTHYSTSDVFYQLWYTCFILVTYYPASNMHVLHVWYLIAHLIRQAIVSGIIFHVWHACSVHQICNSWRLMSCPTSDMHSHCFWHFIPRLNDMPSTSDILFLVWYKCAVLLTIHFAFDTNDWYEVPS